MLKVCLLYYRRYHQTLVAILAASAPLLAWAANDQHSQPWALYGLVALLSALLLLSLRRHAPAASSTVTHSCLPMRASGDEWWEWRPAENLLTRGQHWPHFPCDNLRHHDSGAGVTIHPKDQPRVEAGLQACLDGKQTVFQETYRLQHGDSWKWVLDRGAVVEQGLNGSPLRIAGILTDVSTLMNDTEQHRLFARTLEHISDGVMILDRNFNIVDINLAFSRITGHPRDAVIGQPLTFSRYPQQFSAQIRNALVQQHQWQGELEETRVGGGVYLLELTIDAISDDQGEVTHYVGVFSDISQRKRTEQELLKLANSDTLTELPNRSLFYANHRHLTRRQQPHALMVFDLDNFKKINDSLGHMAGDRLLCAVADRLKKCCSSRDTLYRLGGDEFAVIIEGNNNLAHLSELAQRALSTVNESFRLQQTDIFVTSSVGIALYPLDGKNTEDLLKKADTAMYHAKAQGANRAQFFSESMNEQAIKRIQMEALLRQALRNNGFEMHYQPQYSIERQEMIGMEALVRLRHPEQGLIYPGDFIPLAEESELIIEIGEVTLRLACLAAQRWREQGLFQGRMAVNLSARQLELADFGERLRKLLQSTGLPPRALELEITEGSVMQSTARSIATMQAIRQQGIWLALDDFGTGYSSLAYLKQFPVTTLKIDRTFVKDLESSLEDRKMASAIITIAHNLGIEVIAEGVETESQLHILSAMNCEICQGYLLGKPMDEASMTALLKRSGGRMEFSSNEQRSSVNG